MVGPESARDDEPCSGGGRRRMYSYEAVKTETRAAVWRFLHYYADGAHMRGAEAGLKIIKRGMREGVAGQIVPR